MNWDWKGAVMCAQIIAWIGVTIYFQIRAYKAEREARAWKRLLFRSIDDAVRLCFGNTVACHAIKAALEGKRVYVTKAAEGMTLLEAQQHIDEILGPFYPPKGSA